MNASIQLKLAASLPSNANVKVASLTLSFEDRVEGRRVYTVLALLVAPPSSILLDREVTMKLDVDVDGDLKTCCWENEREMKDRRRVKRSILRCCIGMDIGIEGIMAEYE